MKVKEIERTANVAWSPAKQHPVYLAAGTAAQQLDATFSTNAALEIYALNLQDPQIDMKCVGSINTDFRFHKLQWSPLVLGEQQSTSVGTLVGGADNGNIFVWDAQSILSGGEDTLRCQLNKHSGAVTALDFNPFQDNLLASGASESEIYIWDLNSPVNPMTPGQKSQPPDDVTCVAWNKQVQHIMASTYAGRCVVWDLRKNEPIIKVSDSMSRIKCKLVEWHPEVPTQMILSSEDDHSPVLQLWDLRFATSPLKILESHQRGILSMAWCPQDPDLLVSCGKDNRILCWNPNTPAQMGEVVYELPTTNQWSFDVQWCPRNPAMISSCSFDGHISVYSLMGGSEPVAPPTVNKIADSFPADPFSQAPQQPPAEQTKKSAALKRPPKWLRRPVGASFGFGGKLITFEQQKPQNPQQPLSREVTISRVVTETKIVDRSNVLERALESGKYEEFCEMKLREGRDRHEETLWKFLKAHFEEDPRASLLHLVGYADQTVGQRVSSYIQTGPAEKQEAGELSDRMGSLSTTPEDVSEVDGSVSTDAVKTTSPSSTDDSSDAAEAFEKISRSELEEAENNEVMDINIESEDPDGLLTQALLTADFKSAVDMCVHSDRMAEAIILAMAGGAELLQETQTRFFKKQNNKVSRLISMLVTRDYDRIVSCCNLECWSQTLAVLLTYTKGEQFVSLTNELGRRLEAEGSEEKVNHAALCYLCAGNVPKTLECLKSVAQNNGSADTLQDMVETLVLLRKALERRTGQADQSSSTLVADTLSQYAELLAAQGNLTTAIGYLGNSNQELSKCTLPEPQVEISLAILRDRLCNAIPTYQGALPAKPFQVMSIQPEGVKVTPQQAIPESRADGQRQRTNSGYYQSQAGNFQTNTTSTFTPFSQGAYRQAGTGVATPSQSYIGGQQPYTSGVQPQPTTALSKGPLSQKYPVYPGTSTSAPYDPYSANPNTPVSTYTGYASNANYPGQTGAPQPGQLGQPGQPAIYNPGAMATSQTSHTPGAPHSAPQPGISSYHTNPTPHAGWNDPPLLKPSKKAPVTSTPASVAPITAPLYGGQAIAEQNPPGAPSYAGQNQMYYPPQQTSQPQQQPQATPAPEPPKPVEKGPIPAEHLVLQEVLEKLANQCLSQSNNPHIKRKLEDVLRKLETLYDKLREQMLSDNVTLGLHQIIQFIQAYDYNTALQCHARMVSQGNFSEISSFMPGIKMLMQTAIQMNVFIPQ